MNFNPLYSPNSSLFEAYPERKHKESDFGVTYWSHNIVTNVPPRGVMPEPGAYFFLDLFPEEMDDYRTAFQFPELYICLRRFHGNLEKHLILRHRDYHLVDDGNYAQLRHDT